jgi:hypothetical protein
MPCGRCTIVSTCQPHMDNFKGGAWETFRCTLLDATDAALAP